MNSTNIPDDEDHSVENWNTTISNCTGTVLSSGSGLIFSSSSAIKIHEYTMSTKSAKFIRECFPVDWNIVSVNCQQSQYNELNISVVVKGAFDSDAMHEYWGGRMTNRDSSWSPGKEITTTFIFKTYSSSEKELEEVHKEVFDSQFIKDFENIEK